MLALSGCPGAGTQTVNTPILAADAMPTEPQALLQTADAQFALGGTGVQNSITALRRALDKNPEWAAGPEAYNAHWRLTRAYAEQCETSEDDAAVSQISEQGIEAGRKAVALSPDRVEGHYYLAQLVGFQAKVQKGESKERVAEMLKEGERAEQIDAKFDHGGPSRMLGAIYAKAPAPPLSVGDPEKAVKYLSKAVELDGEFPANTLYLASAQVADERYQDAEKSLAKARQLMEGSKWDRYRAAWDAERKRIEGKLRARQGG